MFPGKPFWNLGFSAVHSEIRDPNVQTVCKRALLGLLPSGRQPASGTVALRFLGFG